MQEQQELLIQQRRSKDSEDVRRRNELDAVFFVYTLLLKINPFCLQVSDLTIKQQLNKFWRYHLTSMAFASLTICTLVLWSSQHKISTRQLH